MDGATPDRRLVRGLRIGRRGQYPLYPLERSSVRRCYLPYETLQRRHFSRGLLARNDCGIGIPTQIRKRRDIQAMDHRAGDHARGRLEDADEHKQQAQLTIKLKSSPPPRNYFICIIYVE